MPRCKNTWQDISIVDGTLPDRGGEGSGNAPLYCLYTLAMAGEGRGAANQTDPAWIGEPTGTHEYTCRKKKKQSRHTDSLVQ